MHCPVSCIVLYCNVLCVNMHYVVITYWRSLYGEAYKNYDMTELFHKLFLKSNSLFWYCIIQIMNVYECNGKNIFMR